MVPGPGDVANKLGKAVGASRGGGWKARLSAAAAVLKAEYEAGQQGDDAPSATLWAPPAQQLDAFVGVLSGLRRPSRSTPTEPPPVPGATDVADLVDVACGADVADLIDAASGAEVADLSDVSGVADQPPSDTSLSADADEVSGLLQRIDWAAVRDSASARSGDATRAVRAMAAQVDWAKVQPVAAQASSLLIAAVASGQMPVVGRTGTLVARAMLDDGGLGERVGRQLMNEASRRPEMRTVIGVVDSIASQRPPAAG